MLAIHILAGALALIFGYVALYAAKGAKLHRQSGGLFVYAMLAMSIFGIILEAQHLKSPSTNFPAALLAAYMVITSLLAVQAPSRSPLPLKLGAMILSLGIGITCLAFAIGSLLKGNPAMSLYTFPYLMFGSAGLLGGLCDIRVLQLGSLEGPARIARHLWRMCFALFIAAMSFFLGQAKVIPKPIRIPALLVLPVLAVLLTMIFWLWKVRIRPAFLLARSAKME